MVTVNFRVETYANMGAGGQHRLPNRERKRNVSELVDKLRDADINLVLERKSKKYVLRNHKEEPLIEIRVERYSTEMCPIGKRGSTIFYERGFNLRIEGENEAQVETARRITREFYTN